MLRSVCQRRKSSRRSGGLYVGTTCNPRWKYWSPPLHFIPHHRPILGVHTCDIWHAATGSRSHTKRWPLVVFPYRNIRSFQELLLGSLLVAFGFICRRTDHTDSAPTTVRRDLSPWYLRNFQTVPEHLGCFYLLRVPPIISAHISS